MLIHRDTDRVKIFNRRAIFLGGAQALLFSGLVGRMHYLQVVESDRYSMLAEENRINLRLIPPTRGRILDRYGEPLAINIQNFRMLIVAEQVPNLERVLNTLGEIIDLSDREVLRIISEVKRRRSFVPVTVKENLTWKEMAKIQVNALDLPGVVVDEGLTRFYPDKDTAAHILGYVSSVDEHELTGDPLLQLPGFRIGKAGLEKEHDNKLRGGAGNSQFEVNAMGRAIRELKRKESTPGSDLYLTLDQKLQKYVSERMGLESASCVVMNVHTGEVLAMVSTPSFDPNAFNRGLTQNEWKSLLEDPRAPMTNKAISGQYAPGSAFKMIVALAALEHGLMDTSEIIKCKGFTDLGERRFHCWEKDGHGKVAMVDAIASSCDIFFYEVAKRLGVARISEMARRFGLGDLLNIGLSTERGGLVPSEEWKKNKFGEPWQQGETFILGIGQGYILTTPLQLAVMTSRIATSLKVMPKIIKSPEKSNEQKDSILNGFQTLNVNQSDLQIVREGMFNVVNGNKGTAKSSRININGHRMSGKTGTTQVKRITMEEREKGLPDLEEIPWEDRSHALFVAYAPHDNPKFAISVVVEHGGGGSAVAAPIAKDIFKELLRNHSAQDNIT